MEVHTMLIPEQGRTPSALSNITSALRIKQHVE
jgi:hypothetical protein